MNVARTMARMPVDRVGHANLGRSCHLNCETETNNPACWYDFDPRRENVDGVAIREQAVDEQTRSHQ